MKVRIIRNRYQADGIFGTLTIFPGGDIAVTLEHAYLKDDGTYAPKVPAGTYQCELRHSPKFGRELYEVLNVPDHTHILFHEGNYNRDSDGCFLIGKALGRTLQNGFMITSSIQALDAFMKLQDGKPFTLEVVDDV